MWVPFWHYFSSSLHGLQGLVSGWQLTGSTPCSPILLNFRESSLLPPVLSNKIKQSFGQRATRLNSNNNVSKPFWYAKQIPLCITLPSSTQCNCWLNDLWGEPSFQGCTLIQYKTLPSSSSSVAQFWWSLFFFFSPECSCFLLCLLTASSLSLVFIMRRIFNPFLIRSNNYIRTVCLHSHPSKRRQGRLSKPLKLKTSNTSWLVLSMRILTNPPKLLPAVLLSMLSRPSHIFRNQRLGKNKRGTGETFCSIGKQSLCWRSVRKPDEIGHWWYLSICLLLLETAFLLDSSMARWDKLSRSLWGWRYD